MEYCTTPPNLWKISLTPPQDMTVTKRTGQNIPNPTNDSTMSQSTRPAIQTHHLPTSTFSTTRPSQKYLLHPIPTNSFSWKTNPASMLIIHPVASSHRGEWKRQGGCQKQQENIPHKKLRTHVTLGLH